MKILVAESVNRAPHLETSFELVKRHLDAGDEVHFCFVGHAVENTHWVNTAASAENLPEIIGIGLLRHPNLIIHDVRGHSSSLQVRLPSVSSVSSLLDLKYGNYFVGDAALSSLAQMRGSQYLDVRKEMNVLAMIMRSGIFVYEYIERLLRLVRPNRVYTFNGRFSSSRAVVDAAHQLGIDCYVHERGATQFKYVVRPFPLHDVRRNSQFVKQQTENLSLEKIKKKAECWYRERRNGNPQDWVSFTKKQVVGSSVKDSVGDRRLITYFSSTEAEFVGMFGVRYFGNNSSQLEVIKRLIDLIEALENSLILAIRIHPNERCGSVLQWFKRLPKPSNVKIFFPNDAVDTYQLIEDSVLTLSCGSTVGPESVYWGTPAISLASGDYDSLDCCYKTDFWEELQSLICNPPSLTSSQYSGSLRYGYYRATFGEEFKHYTPNDLFSGAFMGVDLHSAIRLPRHITGLGNTSSPV